MKKIIKYIKYIFIIIISLLIILIVFSQTSIFKDLLRDVITDKLNKSIEGKILIGSLKGNLFSNIEIENIQIIYNNKPVISAAKIEIGYNPLSLLENKINVRSLLIDSIDFNLVQLKDSSWNISKLFTSSEDTASGSFNWAVLLDKAEIKGSYLKISPLDSTLDFPKEIKNINLEIAGFYTEDNSSLKITSFSFITSNPSFIVKDFRFNVRADKNELLISDLHLKTGLNIIYADGDFKTDPFDILKINLKTEPLNISEFNYLTGFRLKRISPSIILNLNKKDKNIFLKSTLEDKKQLVKINIHLTDSFLPEGTAEIKISSLNPADIFEENSLDGLINGSFFIKGYWKAKNDCRLELSGDLFNSSIFRRKIDNLKTSGQLNNGNLKSDINILSGFGSIGINSEINGIFERPVYSYHLTFDNADLSRIFYNDALSSNLNFIIYGNGTGFNPEYMTNNIKIAATKSSRFNKYRIDSLLIRGTINNNHYILDSLLITNGKNKIAAAGEYLNSNIVKSNLHLSLENFDNLKPFIKADTLYGKLIINGEVSGFLDSLAIISNINSNNFHYNNMFLGSAAGKANGIIKDSGIEGNYKFQINNSTYDSINFLKLELAGIYKDGQLISETGIIFSDSLKTYITSSIEADTTVSIFIPQFIINNGDKTWRNINGPIDFSADNNTYILKNFNLQNNGSLISIEGEIKDNKELAANINIDSLELGNILNKTNLKTKFTGLAEIKIKVEGNTDEPEAAGNFKLYNLNIDHNNLGNLKADFNLRNNILNWDLSAVHGTGNQLKSSGFIPLNLFPENSGELINKQKQSEINLSMDNYDLSKSKLFTNYLDKIEGNASGNITVKNNMANPLLKGNLQLSVKKVQNNKLGIDYSNIKVDLQIDSNRIKLDTAEFSSKKGMITISGYAGSKSNILKDKLNDVNINLHSSNFELLNSKGTSVTLDGDLHFFSNNDSTRFYGEFEIPGSSFYLNTLGGSKFERVSDSPLLLRVISKKNQTGLKEIDSTNTPPPFLTFGKDINGQIKITIPDNTWIKNPNINIELKGELIIDKTNNNLSLTGKIKTGRGYLYLYGKKFTVIKGELIFKGEQKINPFINVTIEYIFRNPSREKEKINIDITNTLNNPVIKFTHNDEVISEGDAVSFILFGIKMENLTQSQQSELSGNQNILTNALAGMLASQLSSKLGRTIGLDVLEITSDENWQNASLTAGKYLSNDLFVSYERNIQIGNSNETDIEKINFEYELFHFLFLQLIGGNSKETGINFILKFD